MGITFSLAVKLLSFVTIKKLENVCEIEWNSGGTWNARKIIFSMLPQVLVTINPFICTAISPSLGGMTVR